MRAHAVCTQTVSEVVGHSHARARVCALSLECTSEGVRSVRFATTRSEIDCGRAFRVNKRTPQGGARARRKRSFTSGRGAYSSPHGVTRLARSAVPLAAAVPP